MMKDVLGRLESVLDTNNRSLGAMAVSSQIIGTLYDPNGCLSQFAKNPAYKGYWDVVCYNVDAGDYPWLVPREGADGYRYEFADGLVQVQWFFHVNGKDVTVRTTERDDHNLDLWCINDSPENRGIAFDYRVYVTVIDYSGDLNQRSIDDDLGRKEKYTDDTQRKWDIVFTNGRFLLRKCCDHTAKYVLKNPDGGTRQMVDIRKMKFSERVDLIGIYDCAKSFMVCIPLLDGAPRYIGCWYPAHGD
jgi:hypothetical protein